MMNFGPSGDTASVHQSTLMKHDPSPLHKEKMVIITIAVNASTKDLSNEFVSPSVATAGHYVSSNGKSAHTASHQVVFYIPQGMHVLSCISISYLHTPRFSTILILKIRTPSSARLSESQLKKAYRQRSVARLSAQESFCQSNTPFARGFHHNRGVCWKIARMGTALALRQCATLSITHSLRQTCPRIHTQRC